MSEIEPAASGLVVIRPDADAAPVAYTDLDYAVTTETAEALIAATPVNTRRAYDRAWGQFETWCGRHGRVALPATAQTLADYVHDLCVIDLAPATIDQAIGVIRATHRDAGWRDQPDTVAALKLLRGYRQAWAERGGRVRQKTAILLPDLRAMVATCDLETPGGIRDRAILLLGFNMMARRSELANLDLVDVHSSGENGIRVFVRQSKTDQAAKGRQVAVPFGQHEKTCAVRAVRAWTAVLAEHGIRDGALFRPVDRHGRIGDEPSAAGTARPRLTGHAVNRRVRHRAALAGLEDPGGYGAHGLRAGAATTAYAHGVPVSVIAAHGRWSPNSPVVLTYIRAVDEWRDNPMKGIGL